MNFTLAILPGWSDNAEHGAPEACMRQTQPGVSIGIRDSFSNIDTQWNYPLKKEKLESILMGWRPFFAKRNIDIRYQH